MHDGHRQRIRERFASERGFDSFAPHEVLEFLLTFCIPRRDVNEMAHALIDRFGSLSAVLEADARDLEMVPGVGRQAASFLCMLPHLMRCYTRDKWGEKPRMRNQHDAGKYAQTLFYGKPYECFYIICLDAQHRVIGVRLVHEGTLDEAPFYPRNILEEALRLKAKGIILTHNHPGGGMGPSASDVASTNAVKAACLPVGIDVLDHIIVAHGRYTSMAEMKLMETASSYRLIPRRNVAEWGVGERAEGRDDGE